MNNTTTRPLNHLQVNVNHQARNPTENQPTNVTVAWGALTQDQMQ